MKTLTRALTVLVLLLSFTTSLFPCGPSYISPVFEYEKTPDDPMLDFAAGRLGVIRPSYRRLVLFAAYRYLNGGSFNEPEQKALVEVWEAEFRNKEFPDRANIADAVKAWVEKRKSVVGKEEKLPEIYTERAYGGYEFFPNCTRNAFETAAATLSDRIASHGSEDRHVRDWVAAQDKVFTNCSSGKAALPPPSAEMPEWLQKDRAYQMAAADFYSLAYAGARKRFAEIAQDGASPWQEVSEYLVGRTLVREASLVKDRIKSETLLNEADQALQIVSSKGGRYADDAERLLGIVKYRLRPEERLVELAQNLTYRGSRDFRQDVIDFNWLVDKYEKQALETEEKRKAQAAAANIAARANTNEGAVTAANVAPNVAPNDDTKIRLWIISDDYQQNWNVDVPSESTYEQAAAEVERVIGKPLTDKMREQVKSQIDNAFQDRSRQAVSGSYEGGYWGEEPMTRSLLPEFIKQTELADWLFTFQIEGAEAYLYSISKWRQTGADIWLMTALTKADRGSTELPALIDAAKRVPTSSPAYPTVAYNLARLLVEFNQPADARKYIDEILASPVELPIGSRNLFLRLRMKIADTLDDFLRHALRKPFAFDFDGRSGTLDEIVAEQKSWWNPESFENESKADYDARIDKEFERYRALEKEPMFDEDSFEVLNFYFPTPVLIQAQKSEFLPEYLKKRFVMSIWTRAILFDDEPTAKLVTPELLRLAPEFEEALAPYLKATAPAARKRAALYFILKNPILTPNVESGFNSDNEFNQWDDDNWWCTWWYNQEDGEDNSKPKTSPPAFLTKAQVAAAAAERERLGKLGDAPKYLAAQVLAWQRAAPADKRIPESLFIVYEANGWTKYGCGNNIELQEEIAAVLRRAYPYSEWTKKLEQTEQ